MTANIPESYKRFIIYNNPPKLLFLMLFTASVSLRNPHSRASVNTDTEPRRNLGFGTKEEKKTPNSGTLSHFQSGLFIDTMWCKEKKRDAFYSFNDGGKRRRVRAQECPSSAQAGGGLGDVTVRPSARERRNHSTLKQEKHTPTVHANFTLRHSLTDWWMDLLRRSGAFNCPLWLKPSMFPVCTAVRLDSPEGVG